MLLALALLVALSGCVAAGPVEPTYYGGYGYGSPYAGYGSPYAYAAPPPFYFGGPPVGLNFGFVGGDHFHHRPFVGHRFHHRAAPHRRDDGRHHHRDVH